jgi:cobalt-precorrin 5A hydrolase
MRDLLMQTFAGGKLTVKSLRAIATVDLKADKPGLLALAESLDIPLTIFTRDRLKSVAQVPTPSAMVEKHIGVKSVCEAAALLAAHQGRLLVSKQKTTNVTVAIAADGYISSALDPAARAQEIIPMLNPLFPTHGQVNRDD